MITNYLAAKIAINTTNTENNIILCNSENSIVNSNLNPSFIKKATDALKEKKNTVLVHYGDYITIVPIIVKDDYESLRKLGASIFKTSQNENIENLTINELNCLSNKNKYEALLEGILLSSYSFTKYKKKSTENKSICFYIDGNIFSSTELQNLNSIVIANSIAKTLVNEPVNYLDAIEFSKIATELGNEFGFKTEILNKSQIESLRMGGLLGVNKGSETEPTFNIFKYEPKDAINSQPLVLVGKGVMFDTGGYSIKTGGHMCSMKSDMGGGAAVLGAITAIAANNLPYHVIGLVPATDNKISANALVVDDIITMMDGTTVEVLNTDAEGRLVLADALVYAKKFNPELVIDLATLTGASAAITGPYGIAAMGNSKKDIEELSIAGENTYERLIELPFWSEFEDLLKSDVADLTNLGGKTGGGSTAGKFLEHFTDYPWVHLDIAGMGFLDKPDNYKQSGGTGVGVRLIYNFVLNKLKK